MKSIVSIVSLLFLFLFIMTVANASDFDEYLHAIESGTNEERVVARQMLKREGIRAVPPLIELLKHEDQLVWRLARNVLADIVNEVSGPGFEGEREEVTKRLFAMVLSEPYDVPKTRRRLFRRTTDTVQVSETPAHAVQKGLRLLAIATPEGYDVDPLRILLENSDYRGETLSALHAMGTSQSKALLNEVLKRGGIIHSGPIIYNQKHIKKNEELYLAGGNWDRAILVYLRIRNSSSEKLHAPAIAGLARFGDATVVPAIFEAVKKNPDLEAPALMNLNEMQGLEAYEALLTGYPDAGYEMQLGLLGVFGRKQDTIFLPLLLENAASDDAARRITAFNALIQSDLPGGVDAIVKYVKSRPADDRKFEVMDLLAYADRLHDKGANVAAGKAYLGLYQTASHPDDKAIAFHGIKHYPSPEAYELILADLDLDQLDSVSAETLIALNVMLKEESNPEAFSKIRTALGEIVKESHHVQSVLDMAAKQGASDQFQSLLGFVRDWHLVGSFPWSSGDGFQANPVGAPAVDLKATYTVSGTERTWKKVRVGQIVNLIGHIGQESSVSAYAFATVNSPSDMDAQIRVGSDDGIRIWLNGKSVHENNVDRGMLLDQDIVDVKLKKGANALLLQVTQGGGGWGFMCRVTHPDGTPLATQ